MYEDRLEMNEQGGTNWGNRCLSSGSFSPCHTEYTIDTTPSELCSTREVSKENGHPLFSSTVSSRVQIRDITQRRLSCT